jgi:hypothetical protein
MSDPTQPDRHTYTPDEKAAIGEDDIVENLQIVDPDDAERATDGPDDEETA